MDEEIGVEITSESGAAVVVFKSASVSDVDSITTASKQIKEFIDGNQPNRLIFDFGKVKFFSFKYL